MALLSWTGQGGARLGWSIFPFFLFSCLERNALNDKLEHRVWPGSRSFTPVHTLDSLTAQLENICSCLHNKTKHLSFCDLCHVYLTGRSSGGVMLSVRNKLDSGPTLISATVSHWQPMLVLFNQNQYFSWPLLSESLIPFHSDFTTGTQWIWKWRHPQLQFWIGMSHKQPLGCGTELQAGSKQVFLHAEPAEPDSVP